MTLTWLGSKSLRCLAIEAKALTLHDVSVEAMATIKIRGCDIKLVGEVPPLTCQAVGGSPGSY
jgi:hypothetical protein